VREELVAAVSIPKGNQTTEINQHKNTKNNKTQGNMCTGVEST
jgi:hypothetical protein